MHSLTVAYTIFPPSRMKTVSFGTSQYKINTITDYVLITNILQEDQRYR